MIGGRGVEERVMNACCLLQVIEDLAHERHEGEGLSEAVAVVRGMLSDVYVDLSRLEQDGVRGLGELTMLELETIRRARSHVSVVETVQTLAREACSSKEAE